MNGLFRKARLELRRQAAFGVQPPLDGLQTRLEAVTEAQHDDLRRQVAELSGRIEDVRDSVTGVIRAENVELTRMLRQQGDASDEVAEILGRTLARLGAEVESLAEAVAGLQARAAGQGGTDLQARTDSEGRTDAQGSAAAAPAAGGEPPE